MILNQKFKLIGFTLNCPKTVRRQLLAFGLTPGIEFEVIRVAPLGDPIEIKLRSYSLSLRRSEFECLEKSEVNCSKCTKGCCT